MAKTFDQALDEIDRLVKHYWSARLPLSILTDFEKFATQSQALDHHTV